MSSNQDEHPACACDDPLFKRQVQGLKDVTAAINDGKEMTQAANTTIFARSGGTTDIGDVLRGIPITRNTDVNRSVRTLVSGATSLAAAAEMDVFDLTGYRPGKWGSRDGRPAIVWWRHGDAAKGEQAILTHVKTYRSDAERFEAYRTYG